MIKCIVAIDEKRGLANDKGIPWDLPTDRKYYRSKLTSDQLLMGYGVYKELSKPYPGVLNYVASRSVEKLRPGFEIVQDARQFLKEAEDDVWNIGGAGLIASTFDLIEKLYITQLEGDFQCTKFFPEYKKEFTLISESPPQRENNINFKFTIWLRKH